MDIKDYYRHTFIFVLIALVLSLTGCASRMTVNVNAISNPAIAAPGTRYVMSSAMDDIDEKDLYFQEFSRYFQRVLQSKGYSRAADKSEADINILLKFGVSDGRTGLSTLAWPIYETIGGESITITETSTDSSGNPVTTTRVIRMPPRVQRVGTSVETRSYTLFNRTASLEARLINKDGSDGEVLWMVLLSSVGESDDLRGMMPYLAAASSFYIGKNTGQQYQVTLEHNDPLVLELKKTLK